MRQRLILLGVMRMHACGHIAINSTLVVNSPPPYL